MTKKMVFLILSLFVTQMVQSADFFSHAIVNLPYEYQTNEQWIRVINSNEEWESFYLELTEPQQNLPELVPLPEIDFDVFTLVVGGLGLQPSGRTRLSIGRIIQSSQFIYVSALSVSAGVGCAVGAAATFPTVGFLISKTERTLKVFIDESVSDCN